MKIYNILLSLLLLLFVQYSFGQTTGRDRKELKAQYVKGLEKDAGQFYKLKNSDEKVVVKSIKISGVIYQVAKLNANGKKIKLKNVEIYQDRKAYHRRFKEEGTFGKEKFGWFMYVRIKQGDDIDEYANEGPDNSYRSSTDRTVNVYYRWFHDKETDEFGSSIDIKFLRSMMHDNPKCMELLKRNTTDRRKEAIALFFNEEY